MLIGLPVSGKDKMYDVAQFIKSKREDHDNGCGPTERADLDAFRLERVLSTSGALVRDVLRIGLADCPNGHEFKQRNTR